MVLLCGFCLPDYSPTKLALFSGFLIYQPGKTRDRFCPIYSIGVANISLFGYTYMVNPANIDPSSTADRMPSAVHLSSNRFPTNKGGSHQVARPPTYPPGRGLRCAGSFPRPKITSFRLYLHSLTSVTWQRMPAEKPSSQASSLALGMKLKPSFEW